MYPKSVQPQNVKYLCQLFDGKNITNIALNHKTKNKMGLELFLTAPLYFYNLFCVKNKFTVINYMLLGKTQVSAIF